MTETLTLSRPTFRGLLRRLRGHSRATLVAPVEEKSIEAADVARNEPIVEKSPNTTVQSALLVVSKGTYSLDTNHPRPTILHDNEVIIRTKAVGLNPIDWKSVAYNFCLPSYPWVIGRELSGIVTEVGSAVSDIAIGDEVWTSTYYRDSRAGCFQEYVAVPGHTVMPIPSRVDTDEAPCLGVAGLTAAMTLWRWLNVPCPLQLQPEAHGDEEWLLIWGGSTVTGQFATQLAVLSGLKVITVTSSKTERLSRSLGATHVVTRDGKTDDEIVEGIRLAVGDKITRAIDLVGPKTAGLALRAVSSQSPVSLAPLAMIAADQEVGSNVTVHTVEMKQFVLDSSCRKYAQWLNALVGEGRIVFPELRKIDGGLAAIVDGLDVLRQGDMSGKKLVIRL
ncbi:GroES-like protein [Periconia macrospinosa]|uniref:GroES-like protein n=1 Tax=Periconia macrospinosa TaxID=97972 RepID=A0A2V1DFY9_9PLEO|nr:GroES-like protein [Periconia macrospinosa]